LKKEPRLAGYFIIFKKRVLKSSEQVAMAVAKLFSLPYIDLRALKLKKTKLKIWPADVC